MPSILNSDDGVVSGTSGLKSTGGNDGLLNIQSNGSTVLAVTGSGIAVTGTMSQTGASTFAAGTAGAPSITFTGDTNTGIFSPAADTIAFSEGGAEAMRIDSSGNVGIGVTPNNNKFIVKGAHASGRSIAGIQTSESASGAVIYLGFYNSSDSRIAYVGSEISTQFQVWNVENTPMLFGTNNSERMRILANGTIQTVSTISVGNATPTTSGAGITFPATQSASSDANTLDDYEEGTWTPTLGGQTTDPSSVTYITQTGNYTKIGNVVCIFGKLAVSAITGGSGFAIIKGLPFTIKNSNVGAGCFAFYSYVALGAGYTQLGLQILANTTTIRFSKSGTGITGYPANIGDIASGGNFDCDFQITYEV